MFVDPYEEVDEQVSPRGVRTILSPDISQLVKFAGSDNSQLVSLQGRTFLSYLFCRAGHFSVTCFAGSDNS